MLNKLAIRNARCSFSEYLIYLITMVIITALMFAFDSMLFSSDIQEVMSEAGMLALMIGFATFFIVLIIIWLIHYMMKFMAEKRSREFATYLLLGFHKKQIANLFLKETVLLGLTAFLIGIIPGILLQQIITVSIYAIVDAEYSIHLELKAGTFLLTAAIFCGSYFLALFRNKRRFKKMNITDMMYLDRKNEELKNGNKSGKQWLFFVFVSYMLFFGWIMVKGCINNRNIFFLIFGLVISVYLLYIGLSAFLIGYIRKGGEGIWKEANIFVLRQMAAKVKTMQFTLGTLTILFMVALLGASFALMLNQFQTTQSDINWPFEIAAYHPDPEYDFARENLLIEDGADVKDKYIYRIFENGSSYFKRYMEKYYKEALDESVAGEDAYFKYDTYMKLSDYNHLRSMLGYKKVGLDKNGYYIHMKERLEDAGSGFSDTALNIGGKEHHCAGINTEGFEQNGHNGADYLLVIPDEAASRMKPYYSLLMAKASRGISEGLKDELLDSLKDKHNSDNFEGSGDRNIGTDIDRGFGTDIMYVDNGWVFIREIEVRDMKSMLSMLIFPLFYVGLVFLCVALTVLAVQQLSDSAKYKYRYSLLRKLGMNVKELNHVILKQLFLYYLCPFAASCLISSGIVLFVGKAFTSMVSNSAPAWSYLGISVLLFGGIYLIYFTATYVEFKRNVGVGEGRLPGNGTGGRGKA